VGVIRKKTFVNVDKKNVVTFKHCSARTRTSSNNTYSRRLRTTNATGQVEIFISRQFNVFKRCNLKPMVVVAV